MEYPKVKSKSKCYTPPHVLITNLHGDYFGQLLIYGQ